jgi:hypothetical protein
VTELKVLELEREWGTGDMDTDKNEEDKEEYGNRDSGSHHLGTEPTPVDGQPPSEDHGI